MSFPTLVQSIYIDLSGSSINTTSTAFPPTVVLLTQNITLASTKSIVEVHLDFSGDIDTIGSQISLALAINNSVVRCHRYSGSLANVPFLMSQRWMKTVGASGSIAVEARWGVSANTARCVVGSDSLAQGASLLINEWH